MTTLKTRPLCRFQALLDPVQHNTGIAHHGRRVVAVVTGGAFEGERLNGTVLGGGGDWATIDHQRDVMRIDVRLTWQTDDDAKIFVSYTGVFRPASKLLGGIRPLPDDELYFRATPIFETGDPRYQWLTDIVTVAIGSTIDGGVQYEVFEVL